jgi:hypothetical protein
MSVLIAAFWLALAPAQDAAPVPPDGEGEWVRLRYAYPAPTTGGSGIDYWISLGSYGEGPDAEGVVRVRVVSPNSFNDQWQPTVIHDAVKDVDCVNRRERRVVDGVPDEWVIYPDFVPGSQTIYDVCSPNFIRSRAAEPDLAAALALSSREERLRHTPNPYH